MAKTVVRGAFGRFYGPSTLAAQGTVGPYGFRVETPWVATQDNLTPLNYLRNPFPQGFRPVPGASDGLLTALGSRVEAPLRETTVPNIWQFNVTVQRELPASILVEAAYVGNRGRELSLGGEGGYTLNQLDPQYMALGTALNQLVPNPFYGYVATGPLSLPTVARGQLLRPYPQFGDIIPLFYPGAESSYDAFQLTVRRRFAGGLGFEGNYVASKSMDWGQSYQDSYDTSSANALSGVHIPYRLVLSTIYQLPIGRDRAIGRNMSPALDAIVGGWQVNGIWTLQAGPMLTLGVTNSAGVFGQALRANWNGAGSDDRRKRGRQAGALVRSVGVQPAGAVHVRQRARTHPRPARASSEQRGLLGVQGSAADGGSAAAGADRGVQSAELRAVRQSEYDAEQRLDRTGDVAGERAASDAVRREDALVIASSRRDSRAAHSQRLSRPRSARIR